MTLTSDFHDYLAELDAEDFVTNNRYANEIERLVKVMRAKGYALHPIDASIIWSAHSGDLSAGWLALPAKDEQIVEIILEKAAQLDYHQRSEVVLVANAAVPGACNANQKSLRSPEITHGGLKYISPY